jgi:hypothetical protein
LRRGVQRDAGVPVVGDGGVRLKRQVKHFLTAKFVLELMRGRGIGCIEIAPSKLET